MMRWRAAKARLRRSPERDQVPESKSGQPTVTKSAGGHSQSKSVISLGASDNGYQIPAGESSTLVSLANIENIQAISFLNDGAQGEYTVSLSNADRRDSSPPWQRVAQRGMSQGAVSTKIGPGEAKYVKPNLKITHPGRIAAFGVYATQLANVGSGADIPSSRRINEEAFAKLKPVGSIVSAGEGRAAVDFPEKVGRCVMIRWQTAGAQPDAFLIAQVAAFGVSKLDSTVQRADGKDGKAILSGKESPKEGPNEAEASSRSA
jgi:hypothetical protein